MKKVKDGVYNVGVSDRGIDLFEGMYRVPNGISYNSYVIIDEKTAVLDTVDKNFTDEWLCNIERALGGKTPDYLIVLHMEPDHSANIFNFVKKYPNVRVVGNAKTFSMMYAYFGAELDGMTRDSRIVVEDGGKLSLGKHELTFVFAPMVHWPEVMVAYDGFDKTLYSADAFGKFGAADDSEPWADEARRYYIGIVGKFGVQVRSLLKKAAALDIETICPLHGPVLDGDLSEYLDLYDKWSSYTPESDGVLIAYTSVYGNTKRAAELLAERLRLLGAEVVLRDLARDDRAQCVAEAFKYSKLVLATTTYNGDIFPPMREFIDCIAERNYKERTVALIENGSWASTAARVMTARLEKCKDLKFIARSVAIRGAVTPAVEEELNELAKELCGEN